MNISFNCGCGSYLTIEEYFYSEATNELIARWLKAHPHRRHTK